jgi:tryptophan-rich sensory protein
METAMHGFWHSSFWQDWESTLIAAGGVTILAGAGASLTTIGAWYENLRKPSWQPPNWMFPLAWTSIFILEAAAAVIGWKSGDRWTMIGAFIVNGVFNILWSAYFFKLRRPDWALREVPFLWLSVVAMMVAVAVHAGPAWCLLIPYLLWVSFATLLNWKIVQLNAPFTVPA